MRENSAVWGAAATEEETRAGLRPAPTIFGLVLGRDMGRRLCPSRPFLVRSSIQERCVILGRRAAIHRARPPRLDHDRRRIRLVSDLLLGEDRQVLHPTVRLLVHLLGIWAEDDALPGAKAPHVDQPMKLGVNLPKKVVLVSLGLEVDVALRPFERPE